MLGSRPRFELRLEHGYDVRLLTAERSNMRQNLLQRNKRNINNDNIRDSRQCMKVTDIGLLMQLNFRIALQRWMQLPRTDIDGNYFLGAVLQCVIGEAAGTGTDIKHYLAPKIQMKEFGHRSQLQARPRNIPLLQIQFDNCVIRDSHTWLFCLLAVNRNMAQPDVVLRLTAGRRQTALHHH